MNFDTLLPLLQRALQARHTIMAAAPHTNAWRLFNGFTEGLRGITIERYAESLVVHNLIYSPEVFAPLLPPLIDTLRHEFPQTESILLKTRRSNHPQQKRGVLVYGGTLARQIVEDGIAYAIDLTLNQDCSFYLDTRNLRTWIRQQAAGLRVLNTFAYTGSLGVAARHKRSRGNLTIFHWRTPSACSIAKPLHLAATQPLRITAVTVLNGKVKRMIAPVNWYLQEDF